MKGDQGSPGAVTSESVICFLPGLLSDSETMLCLLQLLMDRKASLVLLVTRERKEKWEGWERWVTRGRGGPLE